MTVAEVKAAMEVMAAFDIREFDTLKKCEELAIRVLAAAERVREKRR